MSSAVYEPARHPDELGRYFVDRANAGDIDGLLALYESDAVLLTADGSAVTGQAAIRRLYASLLQERPHFESGTANPTPVHGDLALTSTRLVDGGATAEVARRRADGTWRWIMDNPFVAE